jgi:hypothetical protein
MPGAYLLGLTGSLVTIAIFTGTIIFRMGHQAARIEELERWRLSIRQDMHEISDALESVRIELRRLGTVIEERTERRERDR